MKINHRVTRLIFAFTVGGLLSFCSYQWITNTERGVQRQIEEGVVDVSRQILSSYVALDRELEISDPLNRVRAAGKVYIYPTLDGWEVSGQYRRLGAIQWCSFLMVLDSDVKLVSLSVEDNDPILQQRALSDSKFNVSEP
ncbi:MAG: hypothetical protein CMO98_01870 [Woeseia sp.]|nr:hypothetical protein [Woeseia sp.]